MDKVYGILIVDDHKMFREGLSFLISKMDGFKVVGEAPDGISFLDLVDNIDVDIVLMDISMPGMDGIIATAKSLIKHPDLKVIFLSMHYCKEHYCQMDKLGVSGCLLKESGKVELEKALKTVVNGGKYYNIRPQTT